jgi:hypothetical protein
MFLRCKVRRKDGKQHRYWSVVENTRVGGGRVVQRHVLYLGEINDTQDRGLAADDQQLFSVRARAAALTSISEPIC